MVLTLIIGNGFDKNLGLKTSYRDFYVGQLLELKVSGSSEKSLLKV